MFPYIALHVFPYHLCVSVSLYILASGQTDLTSNNNNNNNNNNNLPFNRRSGASVVFVLFYGSFRVWNLRFFLNDKKRPRRLLWQLGNWLGYRNLGFYMMIFFVGWLDICVYILIRLDFWCFMIHRFFFGVCTSSISDGSLIVYGFLWMG